MGDDLALDAGFAGTRRWRPMSLDTLTAADGSPGRRPKSAPGRFRQSSTMSNEGIALSTPAPLYKYLNRGTSAAATLTKNWDDLAKNKPRVLIPKNVNRPFHNLEIDDIRGTRSNPKNMKLGKAARGTSPLDPEYALPSFQEPPCEQPKFLRDSLKLDDIEGSRPASHISARERDHLSVKDIDGAYAGWKPGYRRNFGKTLRDLCLEVHDITPYQSRYVRDPRSEVYWPIEGSQPKKLTRDRSASSPIDFSLRNDDIEGTGASSALLGSKVKMRKQKSASRNMVSTQQEKAELVAVKLLKTKVLEQMRCRSAKEVVEAFRQMDRQASGKLTIDEVENAFRKLDVGLNSAELKVFTTAFDTSFDGFLNYWQLVKHIVPVVRKGPRSRDSKVVSMALSGWSRTEAQLERDLQRVRDDYYAAAAAEMNQPCDQQQQQGDKHQHQQVEESTPTHYSKQSDGLTEAGPEKRKSPTKEEKNDMYSKEPPLPLGGPFWRGGKTPEAHAKPQLSLFGDHHEPYSASAHYQIQDDSQKSWAAKIGNETFTGEGDIVCRTSYSDGGNLWHPAPDRLRPSTAMTTMQGRRSSSLSASSCRPETGANLLSASACSYEKAGQIKRPQSASVLIRGGRPDCMKSTSIWGQNFTRASSPFASVSMPPKVQRRLSQQMEDIAAVKALN